MRPRIRNPGRDRPRRTVRATASSPSTIALPGERTAGAGGGPPIMVTPTAAAAVLRRPSLSRVTRRGASNTDSPDATVSVPKYTPGVRDSRMITKPARPWIANDALPPGAPVSTTVRISLGVSAVAGLIVTDLIGSVLGAIVKDHSVCSLLPARSVAVSCTRTGPGANGNSGL